MTRRRDLAAKRMLAVHVNKPSRPASVRLQATIRFGTMPFSGWRMPHTTDVSQPAVHGDDGGDDFVIAVIGPASNRRMPPATVSRHQATKGR